MDEEKPKKETKKEDKPTEDSGKGNKYETTPVIERARQEREKLEAATAAQKIENDRTEQIMAKQALGGTTEAGQTPKVETEDEKWSKGAKERYEGTGMDPTPDDSPTTYK